MNFEKALANDPRWQRFNDASYLCKCCSQSFDGIYDLVCNAPDVWNGPPEQQPNHTLTEDTDALTEDFCVMGDHRFVHCLLPIPIQGSDQVFSFGVWGTLSIDNFNAFCARFDDGTQGDLGSMFSWLSNAVPTGAPLPTPAVISPRNDRQRPYRLCLESGGN
ncbi:DUF2199 domain-containing protein [Profundibacter sp.]|uniref:DUF2199 domain-containing protein n=1 Tax=Profundibacter sp. TaxID=3101071 RepID=UPI003D124A8A